MNFKKKYTTAALKAANPVAEKDKTEVTDEAYLQAELFEAILLELRKLK